MNLLSTSSLIDSVEVSKWEVPQTEDPLELVQYSIAKFEGLKVIMTTAFGMEGCALIDMYSQFNASMQVAWIDTGFFFPETRQLIKQMTERYPNIDFVKWESPISVQDQSEQYGEALWQSDPTMCCKIRKVAPMLQNMLHYQVWISGIRKTQTQQRSETSALRWNPRYQVAKFSPLAHWTRGDVWNYVQENDVPFNQLHQQGFPSIGCFQCTRAVPNSLPSDDTREGRWQGTSKTECGLHYSS